MDSFEEIFDYDIDKLCSFTDEQLEQLIGPFLNYQRPNIVERNVINKSIKSTAKKQIEKANQKLELLELAKAAGIKDVVKQIIK